VSEDPFPSGPWVGFYNCGPGDRHRMDLHLTFADGIVTGDGNDDVGRFLIRGGCSRVIVGKTLSRSKTNAEVLDAKEEGMAGAAGLEPVTSAVTGQRSNQLSYAPASRDRQAR
jgi:hypothetical protein